MLDENVPLETAQWLRDEYPNWFVFHVLEVGLSGEPDSVVFAWAQTRNCAVVTYDEDFADKRVLPASGHWGVVRLRVFPTDFNHTREALMRAFHAMGQEGLQDCVVIVDANRIRIRRAER